LEGLHIHDLDEEEIPRGGTLDLKRPAQVMHPGQVDVEDVVGRVVVPDLAAGPGIGSELRWG